MRISDWSSDVCSSYLAAAGRADDAEGHHRHRQHGDRIEAVLQPHAVDDPDEQPAGDETAEHAPDQLQPQDADLAPGTGQVLRQRSEEQTSELQSLMRNTYADVCLQNKVKLH